MSEPTPAADPSPNGPPATDADARLSRIEAALAALAAQQMAGPPPEGYTRPGSPPPPTGPSPLAQLGTAVELAQMTGQLPGGQGKRAWLKWPVVREVILVCRLYFDKRYSPTRWATFGVPAILGLLVAASVFLNLGRTPVLTTLIEYPVVMVGSVFLYRILAAEVTRYAAVLEYLAKTGRG